MKSWYAIRAAASSAEILIYDEIGAFGVSAKQFAEDLKALGAVTTITLRINSPGGSVFDGIAIYNALKRHTARKVVTIDGLAASIASVVAMAGDEIVMPENAMLMIHDPSGVVIGTAPDMRAMADALERIKGGLVAAYRDKTGKPETVIQQLMAEETWMTAAEAVALGFADRVEKPVRIAASFDLARFRRPPEAVLAAFGTAASSNEQEKTMTDTPDPAGTPAAPPAADSSPATPPDPAAIEARARAQALAYAREVAEVCALAGEPGRAAAFLAKATPIDDVRRALIEARAAADAASAIDGHREPRAAAEPPADRGWGDVIVRLFPRKKES